MQTYAKHGEQVKRGLTYDLWKNFPADEILIRNDSSVGQGCQLNPAEAPYAPAGAAITSLAGNGVKAYTDATCTVGGLTKAQYSGGSGFRMLASADNESAMIQYGGGGEPFIISDAAADIKELVFEAHFRVNTVTANDLAFFIGLAGAGIGGNFIADNGADVADLDMVGLWHGHADTTGVDIIHQITGGAMTTHEADFATIAVDTWYVFGMRYVPTNGKLDLYWGPGTRATDLIKDANPILSTTIAAATFPDGEGLCPTFCIKGGHADDKTLDVRTFACAQVAYPAD